MQLELTNEEAAILREFLGRRLGDLSMEISHTDNPTYRGVIRAERDALRGVYDALAVETDPGSSTGTTG